MERRRDVRDVKTSDRLRMSSWEYRANEIRLPCCGKTLGNPVIGFWVDWPGEGRRRRCGFAGMATVESGIPSASGTDLLPTSYFLVIL